MMMTMYLTAVRGSSGSSTAVVQDYCQWEAFNASCPLGHVIVMESAKFGRMRLGRCVDTDIYIGCAADVLALFDARCSGRPSCVVQLPDATLHQQQACPKDVVAYLEASYVCVDGNHPHFRSKTLPLAGVDLGFYKGGYPIHLKGAPEVERRSGWGPVCPLPGKFLYFLFKMVSFYALPVIFVDTVLFEKGTLIKGAGVRTPLPGLAFHYTINRTLYCLC